VAFFLNGTQTNSGFVKSDARVCAALGACVVMPSINLGFLPSSYCVGGKDFIDGLANFNLPIAANPELGAVLLGKSSHFSYGIEIDDDRLTTNARQCFPICHFILHLFK
jgi:hypothetical protein